MLFAYFGPETMLPITSVVCGAVGVVLMCWRSIIQFCRNIVRRVWPGSRAEVTKPALTEQDRAVRRID